jgi:hypothetical protein
MNWFRWFLSPVIIGWLVWAAPGQEFQVGRARIDITPTEPIWMAGYGNRNKPSEGVDQPLFVKVLTIRQKNEAPLVLITAEILGFPRSVSEPIAERIEKAFQIPRRNVLLVGSHTHTGPVIASARMTMFDLKPKDAETVENYTQKLQENIFKAVSEALQKQMDARLSLTRAKATFAVNRRVFRSGGVNFGVNPDGPVDHEVLVLRADNMEGKVQAIVFGYACHCTTLEGNWYRIGGDWAGFAQDYLERAYPGATAYFITGCGADANPQPRGQLDFARHHGLEMAGAVSQALKEKGLVLQGPINSAFDPVNLPFAKLPSREEFQKRLEDKNPFIQRHARRFLDMLDRGEQIPTSYPCPVQAWRFGKDLILLGLGGEVVVDYALRLKREIKDTNLWVAGYANDVFSYVPSVRILLEGGYEADFNLIYYGLPTRFSNDVEEILLKKVHDVVKKVR